ncbi:MAG: TM2 domain-containing protein [Candidatus Nanopelagicales bacterium]
MSTPTPPPPEGSSPDVPVTPAPVTPPPPMAAPMAVPVGTSPAGVPVFANGKPAVNEYGQPVSPKSRLAAALLAWFLGIFGIHRFYVGKVGTGIAMIFTLGGLGIWVLVDFIMILVGSFRDKEGLVLNNW